MPIRPRHISGRPEDQPIFTSPTGMDFEKRRLVFPANFIDRIVLKGGDEYVKANDLKTIVNSVVEVLRMEMQEIILHLASMSDAKITKRDTKNTKL